MEITKVDTNTPQTPAPEVLQDRTIKCIECGNDFTFTSGEQSYYKDKGLHDPKRCRKCIVERRSRIKDDIRISQSED